MTDKFTDDFTEQYEVVDNKAKLQALFATGKNTELLEFVQDVPAVEVCEYLEDKDESEIIEFLNFLTLEDRGRIFSELSLDDQMKLFHKYDKLSFAYIFENMSSDIRADLYQELDKSEQVELLPFLEKNVREDVIVLSAYSPDTAGGIMSTDFATVVIHMSASQALAKIRKDAPSQKMIYYIYAVDENIKMLGIISLKDLIMADPDEKIKDIINENYVFATVDEDKEEVAKMIEKYSLVALPILNPYKQLVGIVSYDDAIDVIQDEHTEDLEKFMGIVPSEDDLEYLDTTSIQHFKKRITWIITLAVVSILSGMIIHKYEGVLQHLIILALYMPMMADTGGNSGSQSATVVIRALALGEIEISDWFKILWKEAKVSFMVSLCIGILAFVKILFLSSSAQIPGQYNLILLAAVISLALSLQVISSTLIGAGLPLFVNRLGGDPAVVASPAITTIVDITGLLIYFTIVTTALGI
jgi:magnesium transporter